MSSCWTRPVLYPAQSILGMGEQVTQRELPRSGNLDPNLGHKTFSMEWALAGMCKPLHSAQRSMEIIMEAERQGPALLLTVDARTVC